MSEHDKLVEVTRNADEIQTTFIGFLMDGRVIEIGDINHKPNRDNTRRIVTAVNNHERLVEALRLAIDFINKHPGDPDITKEQVEAWQRLVKANPDALLAALEAEKGGEL